MLSRYSPAFVASGRRTRCAVFAERSIVHLPSGVRRSSQRSYKDLNWQRVIDHIAAEIWIVTFWLGTLVCSRRARQQCITARLCRRDPIVFPAAPCVRAYRVEEIALNPRCAAIEADPDLGDSAAFLSGDTASTEIRISLDGGASWVQGDFLDPISPHARRRWKYDWITPAQPGCYTLLARATGADQRAQPEGHNPNFGSYVIDHPLPIEVFVAAL